MRDVEQPAVRRPAVGPSPRQWLLLRTLLGEGRERESAWRALRGSFDLDRLEPGSYALMPVLYGVLHELFPDDPLVPRLKGIVRHTWYRNEAILRRLADVVRALERGGIHATAMHGAPLAVSYYPRPSLRVLTQLELLVPPGELAPGVGILERSGWRHVAGGSAPWNSGRARLATEDTTCVLRTRMLARFDAPPERDEIESAGQLVPTLACSEEFLYACVGALRDRENMRLQWIADASMIVRSADHRVDWERLLREASAAHVVLRLREATRILLAVGLPVPAAFADAVERLRVPRAERLADTVGLHYGSALGPVRARVARVRGSLGPRPESWDRQDGTDATGRRGPPAERPPDYESAPAREQGGLRGRVLGGVAWKIVSQVSNQAARVVLVVAFARLLTPHEFGLAAEVLVFSMMANSFSDLALGSALVQRRTIDERDRSTVFWTTVAIGSAFTAAGWALAGPLAHLYGEPAVERLFRVASLAFLVTALSATQSALLVRAMNFRRLELTRIASTATSTPVGIVIAVLGKGAWAVVAVQLSGAVVTTVLLWLFSSWRPRLTYSPDSFRVLGAFGSKIFASRVLFYANRNADNFIVGRFLGAAPLGAYALVYNLTLLPITRIAGPAGQVLFPALARLRDPRRVGLNWLRGNRLLVAVSTPAFFGLIVAAPDFVPVVFGPRWSTAVRLLQVMSWVGIVLSLQSLNQTLLQARGEAGSLLKFAFVSSVTNVSAFLIGLRWGVVGVATCFAISRTIGLPLYTWFCCSVGHVSLREFARNVSPVLQAAVGMFGIVLGTRLLLVAAGLPASARLAIVVVVGAAAYAALLAWRAPEVLGEIRRLTPSGTPSAVARTRRDAQADVP